MATLLSKTQAGGVVGDIYIDGSGFHVIDQVYSSGIYRWRKVASVNPDGDGPEIWSGAVAYEVGDVVAVPQGALWRALIANGPNANGLHPSVINNWQFIGMLEAQLYLAGQCYFTGMEAIIRPVSLGLPVNTFPDYRVRANVAQTTVAPWSLARAANWSLVKQTSVGLWVANYVFMAGIVVSHGGSLYRALTTHQSAVGTTPDMIPGTWLQLTSAGAATVPSQVVQTVLAGNEIAIHTNGNGVVTDIFESVTSLAIVGNNLVYTDEAGATSSIDLSLYLDDTNLARLVSGTLNAATGILTVTRDDASTFTIDLSALKDVTTFIGLTDTPSVYGSPGFVTAINPGGDGLVFVDPSALASTVSFVNEAAATAYYAPTTPLGTQIFDSSTGTFKIWDGTSWEELALGATPPSLPNGSTPGEQLVWSGASWGTAEAKQYDPILRSLNDVNAENYVAQYGPLLNGQIYYNTTTNNLRVYDSGNWSDVGGGGGGNLFEVNLQELNTNRLHTIGASNNAEFTLRVNNGSKFKLFGTTMGFTAETGSIAMSNNNGHGITVTSVGAYLSTNAGFRVNNQPGTAGQVLTSQGASAAPIWAEAAGGGGSPNLFEADQTLLPGVRRHTISSNAGLFFEGEANSAIILTANNTSAATSEVSVNSQGARLTALNGFNYLEVGHNGIEVLTSTGVGINGSHGTTGQVLTSQGGGAAPIWAAAGGGGAAQLMNVYASDVLAQAASLQVTGGFYYNTTLNQMRLYNGSAWVSI